MSPRQVVFFREPDELDNALARMKAKIDSPAGRMHYSKRLGTVEPPFGNLRHHKGLDRFTPPLGQDSCRPALAGL